MKTRLTRLIALYLASSLLAGCASTLERLEEVGNPPAHTELQSPTQQQGYKPVNWPTPDPVPPSKQYANSLWQPGARAFFRDQRASRVGDIMRVRIEIDDKAELDNETERERETQENVAAPAFFGLEDNIAIGEANPNNLFDIEGGSTSTGSGSVDREEKIETQVAAVITQVLPNGNYVIRGSQEVRVNYELRELTVQGIVRPEDIDSSNTVDSSQIAEARISYGGRGQITDVQQPRYGTQILDILSPF